MRIAIVAVATMVSLALACVGCGSSQRGGAESARCGPDSHPASDYVRYQPASCPARPTVGSPCNIGPDDHCNYLAPERGPCEFDACSCTTDEAAAAGSASPAGPTWSCSIAVE
jgi:hypothetical protein